MKVGDLVRVRNNRDVLVHLRSQLGVIIDSHETEIESHYEVKLAYDRGWFTEFELEVLSKKNEQK